MSAAGKNTGKKRDPRNGLRMSATVATVFTILGHTVFGFEQPVAQVFVALGTGYSCAVFFEWVDARACHDIPGFLGGGFRKFVDFLLSAHMTSITLSFLLYNNQRLWITAFAVALALGSKYVLRVRQNGRLQHFMNPSNIAIAVVLAVYQWTGVLPWNFTIDLHGVFDWLVPLIIVGLGFRLNLFFTGRLPSIAAWLGTFIALGAFRAWLQGTTVAAELVVLTGIPMVLFTFYMITDPQTSPWRPRSQVFFGAGIALAYTVLLKLHVQYTMFYSVTVICAIRGLWLTWSSAATADSPMSVRVPAPEFPMKSSVNSNTPAIRESQLWQSHRTQSSPSSSRTANSVRTGQQETP